MTSSELITRYFVPHHRRKIRSIEVPMCLLGAYRRLLSFAATLTGQQLFRATEFEAVEQFVDESTATPILLLKMICQSLRKQSKRYGDRVSEEISTLLTPHFSPRDFTRNSSVLVS
jgi:hypothetical protein